QHSDRALAGQKLAQCTRRVTACAMVVGGHHAYVVVDTDGGIEDGDGNACLSHALQRTYQGPIVGRGNGAAIDPAGDHGVDDLDLAAVVGFLVGTAPSNPDIQLAGSIVGPGMDGDK